MPIIRSAFAVIVMSIAIVLPSRAALQKPQAPDRIVAAAVSTGHVRLSGGVDVSQLRIEVRAPGGALVYDSGWRSGNLLDWSMEDEFGHALAYGTYALIATSRDLSGAATSHAGTLHVEASEVRIESDEVEMVSEPPSIVRLHHDGAAGQLITTRGDLTFRFGDFLARRDVEAMRLTPEGNLEVAGVIHAGKGIMFPDGTVQLTAMTPGLFRLPGGASAFQPSLAIAGNGTTNQLAKWIDDLGTLGDSAVTEVAGKVGIGTTAPGTLLHVFGPATSDVFAGLGPDPKNGPGMNYGYSGNTFGRGSGFFNVRPDASATAPNPSLRFMTVNIQRMVITNTGDVGIGTSAPAQKLDVNGNIKLTGVGSALIFPDLTSLSTLPLTSLIPGTGMTGGGSGGPVSLSIANGGVDTLQLHDNAVTAGKIAGGQVVKSVNGLTDAVTITGINGASVTTTGNTVQVSAAQGLPTGAVILGLPGDTTLINAGFTEAGSTDQQMWRPTSSTLAPSPRHFHTAVWTGTQMIVWGGGDASLGPKFQTGARYEPVTDTWTPTSITPSTPGARELHSAVWTGTKMIVWGGQDLVSYQSSGGLYDPSDDSWTPTAPVPGTIMARINHTAVWTGTFMVVWGGYTLPANVSIANGARYRPAQNDWLTVSTVNEPIARDLATAVWTGTTMIVWGGRPNPNNPASLTDTGGRYDPNTDTWNPTPMPTSASGAPTPRRSHTAITDLSTMTVWGGISGTGPENTGARYDPQLNTWVATPTSGAPVGRSLHSAIVTESGDMIVWGGESPAFERTGAILRSADNTWVPLSLQGAPSARSRHTAVWTGGRMIIWGGENLAGRLDTGGQWGFLSVYRKN